MNPNIFFAAFFFPAAAAVLIFTMKYGAAVLQARVRIGQDDAYRDIAARAASAQAETTAALSSVGMTLREIQSRLGAIEKILKDVG
ncbi:MAG: hypothetical protein WDN04_19570 [Rhodospirillales bacterium]